MSDPSHVNNYIKGINKGLLKIMSKMGISCVSSYRGAQLFEIIGINTNVINLCFKNNVSRIEGASFDDIEDDLKNNKKYSLKKSDGIGKGGLLKFTAGGEYILYISKKIVLLLQTPSDKSFAISGLFDAKFNSCNEALLRM